MTKVEELRHHLVIEMADTGCRPHPEGWHEDLADAETEVDNLIVAVEERERERILSKSAPILPKASVHTDGEGNVYVDPTSFIGTRAEDCGAKVYIVGVHVLFPPKR